MNGQILFICAFNFTGVKRAKLTRRSSPFKFGYNNIKMLFDHKKMLPRRKCAASVQSYKEDDVETDDSFICEYRVLTCHLFMLIFCQLYTIVSFTLS